MSQIFIPVENFSTFISVTTTISNLCQLTTTNSLTAFSYSSITELLLIVTTSSVNILISSTPTVTLQEQDSRENNPVIIIIIAAVIVPILLLLLLIVCIIVTSCLIVYRQRQKKRKSNLAVNDDNLDYFKQSYTLNQTSTIVNEVPCDDISNPVYEGNINYIYLVMVHVITIMTHSKI